MNEALVAVSVLTVNRNRNSSENYLIQFSEIEMRIRRYFENFFILFYKFF